MGYIFSLSDPYSKGPGSARYRPGSCWIGELFVVLHAVNKTFGFIFGVLDAFLGFALHALTFAFGLGLFIAGQFAGAFFELACQLVFLGICFVIHSHISPLRIGDILDRKSTRLNS